jgi:hypothetical protein
METARKLAAQKETISGGYFTELADVWGKFRMQ